MAIDENRWSKKVSKPLAAMDPFAMKTLRKEENSKHNVPVNGHIDNHYIGGVKVSESSTQVNIKHETECLAPKPTRPCASSSPRSKMVLEGNVFIYIYHASRSPMLFVSRVYSWGQIEGIP